MPRLSTPLTAALLSLLLLGPTSPRDTPRDAGSDADGAGTAVARASTTAVDLRMAIPSTGPEPVPWNPVAAPPADAPPLLVRGSGFGHGVGLSQYGAQAQALAGRSYRQILGWYYPGVALGRMSADAPVHVNLFAGRATAGRIEIGTQSRNGAPPFRNVAIDPGPGGQTVEVPFGQVWTVAYEDEQFVVRDGTGTIRSRGAGDVRVSFQYTERNPTLLALPQVGGMFQWGRLYLSMAQGRIQPVLAVPLEQYLRGLAEMPPSWQPEALRAQAIAARTFALRRMAGGVDPACACHLGTTQQDQVFRGWAAEGRADGRAWLAAVESTAGQVATHGGELAFTPYSSSHGGRTEAAEDSWAFERAFPYLRAVEDPWSLAAEVANPHASWERALPNETLAEALGTDLVQLRGIRVLRRTAGGTPAELELRGLLASGERAVRRWTGPLTGVAGADLKLAFRAELPSQQIASIGFGPFSDDDGHDAEWEILLIQRAGVMGACERVSRRFCPDGQVTRGQLATYLARAMRLDTAALAEGEDAFADLRGTDVRGAVNALAAKGGALACAEDRFCPDEPLSVAGGAAMLAKARTLSAVEIGTIVEGCDRAGRCSGEPLTRATLARALVRLFRL